MSVARLLDRDRLLGDQDHVGAARDPAHDGDPARVAAHHLDDHHAVVRLGGRVQAVDRLGRDRRPRCRSRRCSRSPRGRCRSSSGRRRPGSRARRRAAPRRRACPRRRSPRARRARRRSKVSRARSTPPSSLYGFVRDVPRIVPPRGRSPEISRGPSGVELVFDQSAPPVPHSRRPRARARNDRRATARMTAFRPGAVSAAGERRRPSRPHLVRSGVFAAVRCRRHLSLRLTRGNQC